jgi:hypothetical protein
VQGCISRTKSSYQKIGTISIWSSFQVAMIQAFEKSLVSCNNFETLSSYNVRSNIHKPFQTNMAVVCLPTRLLIPWLHELLRYIQVQPTPLTMLDPTYPNNGDQIEAETYNHALSVDVLGFLKSTHFRKDDQDQPQTLQCTVSSFLHGGIQSFVKDIATIDDGGQTTSGHDTHSPSTLKLLWVHVPINNTKWVHVYSPIAPRVVKN